MKTIKRHLIFALLLLLITLGASAFAQITPSQDSYPNTADPTTNYGTEATLGVVSSTVSIQATYIKFDLSSIPSAYTGANVEKATLKLYVNSVAKASSFNVDFVNGSWAEKTITSSLAPALGNAIASSVPLTTANANDYVLIDVTTAVQDWLNGSEPNDGLALVPNSGLSATFDSKENAAQSHPAELDIVYASGNAAITGVTTGSGRTDRWRHERHAQSQLAILLDQSGVAVEWQCMGVRLNGNGYDQGRYGGRRLDRWWDQRQCHAEPGHDQSPAAQRPQYVVRHSDREWRSKRERHAVLRGHLHQGRLRDRQKFPLLAKSLFQ